jgi:hypothetical protein
VKNMLQIPSLPLITGSSPLWMHIEAMFIPASVRQVPFGPSNRFTLHFRGHIAQLRRLSASCLVYNSVLFN